MKTPLAGSSLASHLLCGLSFDRLLLGTFINDTSTFIIVGLMALLESETHYSLLMTYLSAMLDYKQCFNGL